MIQLVGTYAGTDVENVPASGTHDGFTSRTIKVMDAGGRTEYARCSRDFFGTLPEVGMPVVLAVWPRPYVSKKDDALRCSWTTYRVVVDSPALASA